MRINELAVALMHHKIPDSETTISDTGDYSDIAHSARKLVHMQPSVFSSSD